MDIINPNNIKAFEGQELSSMTQRLEKLKIEQGVVMETPPEVYDILGKIYNDDAIVLKSIEMISPNTFELGFVFPEYKLVKKGLEHVSGIQMGVAIFQACYTVIGLAIKTGAIKQIISYDMFLENLYNALFRGYDHFRHSKILAPGQQAYLSVEVGDIIKKGNFYTIETKFNRGTKYFLHCTAITILEDRFIK